MFGPGYGIFLIYFLITLIVAPIVCGLTWLTRAQAKERRLRPYLAWLTPAAIGASFHLASVCVYAAASILHFRGGNVILLVYGLAACAAPFSLCGSYRLWKMVRGLPPYRGALPADGVGAETEGVWPPPPSR